MEVTITYVEVKDVKKRVCTKQNKQKIWETTLYHYLIYTSIECPFFAVLCIKERI